MQIKLLNILKEITIKNNNITPEELNNYFYKHIKFDNVKNDPIWKEFENLKNKYNIISFRNLSQSNRNLFYKELQQLVKKHASNNI